MFGDSERLSAHGGRSWAGDSWLVIISLSNGLRELVGGKMEVVSVESDIGMTEGEQPYTGSVSIPVIGVPNDAWQVCGSVSWQVLQSIF